MLGGFFKQAADAAGNAAKAAQEAADQAARAAQEVAEQAASAAQDVAGQAANAAQDAAGAAAEAAGNVAGVVAEGVSCAGEAAANSEIGKAAAGAANSVADGVSSCGERIASTDAGKAAIDVAGAVGSAVSGAAVAAADTAKNAIDSATTVIKENSFSGRLSRKYKEGLIKGFRQGLKQGAYLAGQKRYNFYYAYVATMCYFLRVDGDFSDDEREWLEQGLAFLKFDGGLPEEVKKTLQEIAATENLSFDEVKGHLDKVSMVSLDSIASQLQIAIEADGKITEEEEHAKRLFADYASTRAACVAAEVSWEDKAIETSVREYAENIDRIDHEFKERTKLQDADAAFLVGATMLQAARVLVINSLTEVERAGAGNAKEAALHNAQEKLFDHFEGGTMQPDRLYASKSHILEARGVPYDATRYEETNFKLFKGANHRFATLGHDPVLGLVFGTSNIMTNTISCVKETNVFGIGARIPVTHCVSYDLLGKNPRIGEQVSTIEMLTRSGRRVVDEPDAAAFALIKQLIHIGTDLYTPCGIQIPFANLVLDRAHAEMLTRYVSTGDLLKVGVQAGMAVLVNWLVASLHGCSLIFQGDGSDYALETYQVRTKKILLISNAIATSSSVLQAAVFKNPRCLDLGGAAVFVYRLFSDRSFIAKLEQEYLDAELDKIYNERAAGLI